MRFIYIILFYLICSTSLNAQITISSPLSWAVYQRGLDNKATLDISGKYTYPIVTSIQVRLIDNGTNAVVPGFDWTVIQLNPTKGYFQGKLMNAPAGWFRLEVRAVKSGTVLGSQTLQRVGIGDVFMIAGQSNAQGIHDWVEPDYNGVGWGSADERVVTHDNGMYCRDTPIPFPVFSQILDQTKIGTAGIAAWLWGNLGQRIVDSTGFPVAFFNSGASGSSSHNWVKSMNGDSTIHPFTGLPFCGSTDENKSMPYDTVGMPYANFKRGLNLYNSMFGARSVLWHQGESDTRINAGETTYKSNLNALINRSRNDYDSGLSWMISRVSWDGIKYDSSIIDAQNQVINPGNKIFAGPATDWLHNGTMSNSRDWINLHFTKTVGFPLVNDGWVALILYSGFLSNATPVPAKVAPAISTQINASNQVVMNVPSGYSAYKWIRTDLTGNSTYEGTASEGNTNSLTKATGTYRCWVVSANGNLQVSAPVDVSSVLSLTTNAASCTADVFLSDLKYLSGQNDLGPLEIDKTNGLVGDGDGANILLKSINHIKGIGAYGNSQIEYRLPDNTYYRFQADIGISDDVSASCTSGGVIFKVIADGATIYTSPALNRSSALVSINVDIHEKKNLVLKTEAVSPSGCNRVVWGSPKLRCNLGDIIDPTPPVNLAIAGSLTRCLNFTWAAATDNIGVAGYELIKNGVVVATVNTLSYTLSGLSPGENGSFSVRAFDAAGNKSTAVSLSFTVPVMSLAYMGDAAFCVSQTYLPSTVTPSGGIFNLASGSAATVNSTTGAFISNVVALDFVVGYTVGAGIPGCEDYTSVSLGTTVAPSPPAITSSNTTINQGNPLMLTSTLCAGGSTFVWNFTAAITNPITFNPTTNSTYFAECRKNGSFCYAKSNEIAVKVIPDCYSSLNLIKPNDNLQGNASVVKFNTSGTFQASNVISPINKIEYNSAKSITLSPGFTVEPGVLFKAEIKNCP